MPTPAPSPRPVLSLRLLTVLVESNLRSTTTLMTCDWTPDPSQPHRSVCQLPLILRLSCLGGMGGRTDAVGNISIQGIPKLIADGCAGTAVAARTNQKFDLKPRFLRGKRTHNQSRWRCQMNVPKHQQTVRSVTIALERGCRLLLASRYSPRLLFSCC